MLSSTTKALLLVLS